MRSRWKGPESTEIAGNRPKSPEINRSRLELTRIARNHPEAPGIVRNRPGASESSRIVVTDRNRLELLE